MTGQWMEGGLVARGIVARGVASEAGADGIWLGSGWDLVGIWLGSGWDLVGIWLGSGWDEDLVGMSHTRGGWYLAHVITSNIDRSAGRIHLLRLATSVSVSM
jgi:hypothetical protein